MQGGRRTWPPEQNPDDGAHPRHQEDLTSALFFWQHTHSRPREYPLAIRRACNETQSKAPFDPKVFLSKINGGRVISDYRKEKIVYRQGDPADSVFYIQTGKVKTTVISKLGKEAAVAILGTDEFVGEGGLSGQPRRGSFTSEGSV